MSLKTAEPSSVPWLDQYSFRRLMIITATRFILPSMFYDGYVRKQPVALEEYCAKYWLKKTPRKLEYVQWPPCHHDTS